MGERLQNWWNNVTGGLTDPNRGYGLDDGWQPGDLLGGFLGDARDYFTDWRGDAIAQEQNELARTTLEHQINMDEHGTEIRAQDYEAAGLSPYALAQGGAGGQSSSARAPQLERPRKSQAMRESIPGLIGMLTQIAQISRTKAETDAINAQIPGQQATSEYLTQTLQDRISQQHEALTAQRYQNQMQSYRVTASEAEAMASYYKNMLDAWFHRNGYSEGSQPDLTIQTFESAHRHHEGRANDYPPDLNFQLEWINPHNLANDPYRQMLAQNMALAEAEHNLTIGETYGIRTNQTGWIGMLLENVSGLINNMFDGRDK